MGVPRSGPLSQLSLPPGFRFYPTDEELLVQYLCRKVAGHQFTLPIIGDIDLYKYDPWDLPSKATFGGEKEWYFFSPRDRKYPNGSRPNRVAGSGYWKATGTDKLISTEGRKVGIKKALVFYVGKAPKGTKTNWIMHEYRLIEHSRKSGSSKLDDWVLCRIYKKNSSAQKTMLSGAEAPSKECSTGGGSMSSSSSQHIDEMLDALPELDGRTFALPRTNSLMKTLQSGSGDQEQKPLFNLQSLGSGNFDWASLAALSSIPEHTAQAQAQAQTQWAVNNNYDSNCGNNMYKISLMGQPGRAEEEVQSGLRTDHRVGRGINPGFMQNDTNSSGLTQGGFTNSVDPFGFWYPSERINGFGFTRQ